MLISLKETLVNQSIDKHSVDAIYYKENLTDGIARIELDKKFKNKITLYHDKEVAGSKFQNTFSIDFEGIFKKSGNKINNFTIISNYNNVRIVPFKGYSNVLPKGCVIKFINPDNNKVPCLFGPDVFRFSDDCLLENFQFIFQNTNGNNLKQMNSTFDIMYKKADRYTVTLGGVNSYYVLNKTPEKLIPPAIRKNLKTGEQFYDYIIENITPLGIPFRTFLVPYIDISEGIPSNVNSTIIKVNKNIEDLIKTNYLKYFGNYKKVDYTGRGDVYYLIFY